MNLLPNLAKGDEVLSDTEWEVPRFETIHDSQGNPINLEFPLMRHMTAPQDPCQAGN
ncbi:MAG: hypothetical protein ACI4PT_07715 [Candidatus Avoscillospira sp.]